MQGGETYVESLQVVVQGGLACSDKGYSILARRGVKNRACRGRWVATRVASHGGGLGCEKKRLTSEDKKPSKNNFWVGF